MRRSGGVEGRDIARRMEQRSGELSSSRQRDQNKGNSTEKTLHITMISLFRGGSCDLTWPQAKKGGTTGVLYRAGRPVTQLALERVVRETFERSTKACSVNYCSTGMAIIQIIVYIYVKKLVGVQKHCHFYVFRRDPARIMGC
jgi:hypothetical protein